MKAGGGKAKGNAFEREICKRLSLWWTQAGKISREDIFWRSATSGGRATQRAKKGMTTAGSCGDITFIDPIGAPFLQIFTIELKRGRGHGHPEDLVDCDEKKLKTKAFVKTLKQARESARIADTQWMLICQRDRREAMVYLPSRSVSAHQKTDMVWPPCVKYHVCGIWFWGFRLEHFLEAFPPDCFGAGK